MRKTPILLMLFLVLIILFGKYLPINIQSFFYSISLTIQSFLIFIVPIIILIFIFRSIMLIRAQDLKLIFLLIGSIYISNFIASFISFNFGIFYQNNYTEDITKINQLSLQSEITPFWNYNLPQIISNEIALILGVIAGILIPCISKEKAEKLADKLFVFTIKLMHKVLIPIIPLLILGFLFQLQQYNIFESIILSDLSIIKNLILVSILYILCSYIILSKFGLRKLLYNLNNMMYPVIVAFISMSSTVALPYTIEGVKKNIGSKSKMIISLLPSITNMHLLGDCFLIPACIIIVLRMFNYQVTYTEFLLFLTYFVLMKFTVMTIPSGGILTILPLLKAKLNFTPEMLSLITALYFFLDPFLAFINVLANGGFCLLLKNKIKISNNISRRTN